MFVICYAVISHIPWPYAWPLALVVFVVLCGVVVWLSETTERRMLPSFTAVDPVYPYLAFLPVPVRFPGAKLAAAHHSFHGFVAYCMILEHKHELSARGFIEGGFGADYVVWLAYCVYTALGSTTKSHDPLIGRYDLTHAQRPTL